MAYPLGYASVLTQRAISKTPLPTSWKGRRGAAAHSGGLPHPGWFPSGEWCGRRAGHRSNAMTRVPHHQAGIVLADLTWLEAAQVLTPQTVVVIPLGAAAKEHGPHLRLKNDQVLADALTQRIGEVADVVIAPTVTYSFYPAF